jgi:hypothetical protein
VAPGGDLDGDVHGDVVVPDRDRQVACDPLGEIPFGLGRDHHHPGVRELLDLLGQLLGCFPGGEANSLRQGVMNETQQTDRLVMCRTHQRSDRGLVGFGSLNKELST